MPTKHRRVSVSVDASLERALERARAGGTSAGTTPAEATLIHDLAIEGAEQRERTSAHGERLLEELADPRWTAAHLDASALGEVLAMRERVPLDDVDD